MAPPVFHSAESCPTESRWVLQFQRTNPLFKHHRRKHHNLPAPNSSYGNTLYAASIEGHEPGVKLLLDMGADVNAQSEQYNSALQAASFRGYDQVVRLILDADADVNAWSEQYSSAFYASYQEAEMRHRLALEVQKKVLGHEYPYILMDMYKLASVLECRCKYEEAEEMYRRVVKRQEKMLGRTKQATLSSVSSLGFMLRKQSKYEQAEEMHQRAVKASRRCLC